MDRGRPHEVSFQVWVIGFKYILGDWCREQIHSAVVYQRMLQRFAAVSEEPPTVRQLAAVAFASGLPFVAFGILDNGIMVRSSGGAGRREGGACGGERGG